jgi:hypothetical protein
MYDRRLAAEVADGYVRRARERIREVGIDVHQQPIMAIALVDACQDLLLQANARALDTRPGETRQDAAGEPQGQTPTDPSEDTLSPEAVDLGDTVSVPSEVRCPNCGEPGEIIGSGEHRSFTCPNEVCGYTESL